MQPSGSTSASWPGPTPPCTTPRAATSSPRASMPAASTASSWPATGVRMPGRWRPWPTRRRSCTTWRSTPAAPTPTSCTTTRVSTTCTTSPSPIWRSPIWSFHRSRWVAWSSTTWRRSPGGRETAQDAPPPSSGRPTRDTSRPVGAGSLLEIMSTEPVGWVGGGSLAVMARARGCDGPGDLWIVPAGSDPPVLVVSAIEQAAVRAVSATPVDLPGGINNQAPG